jgi:hypothetical protein
MSPVSDLDLFGFKARAGTTIRASVSGLTSNLDSRLEVWKPNGDILAEGTCDAGSISTCAVVLDQVPDMSGTHYVSVSEVGGNRTGSYQLNVQCLFGNCPFGYFLENLLFQSATELEWDPVLDISEATYDVVRGDLNTFVTGQLSSAVIECLQTGSTLPAAQALDDPDPGDGFFYLVRANSDVGPGFYDTTGTSQIAPRDMGINASPNSCQAETGAQPRFFRISCTEGNWCIYLVTDSENSGTVPRDIRVNVRAEATTATCPPLEEMFEDDWAFDSNQAIACSTTPDFLVGGEWILTEGPVSTPETVFSDCWARCPADGGDLQDP